MLGLLGHVRAGGKAEGRQGGGREKAGGRQGEGRGRLWEQEDLVAVLAVE